MLFCFHFFFGHCPIQCAKKCWETDSCIERMIKFWGSWARQFSRTVQSFDKVLTSDAHTDTHSHRHTKIISLRFCVRAYLGSQGAARRVASSASHLARRIRRNTSPRRKFARCQLQTLTATPVNQLTRSKTGVHVYWDTLPESEYGLNVLRRRLAFARNVDLFFAFFFPAIRSPMFANSI